MRYFNFCFSVALLFFFYATPLFASPLADSCFYVEITVPLVASADDAEEYPDGTVALTSSDLELTYDPNAGNQLVGLRFQNIPLAKGAVIGEAYLQFTADVDEGLGFCELKISAEAADDATPFQAQPDDIGSRTRSSSLVSWRPEAWDTPEESNHRQRSPDLKELVQGVVDRTGWESGNSMAFIINGVGKRVAASYDLAPNQAVRLVLKVEYPVLGTLAQQVFLNEVMPSNSKIADEYDEKDDWIEIYNGGNSPLFLGGMYVTDDLDELTKWQIKSAPILLPGQFSIIWADGQPEQGGRHASFKLKKEGEALALVQEVNGILHILDDIQFPGVPSDVSYGRREDGKSPWVFFGEASPQASNNGKPQHLNDSVRFSKTTGHYSNRFTLEMTVNDPSVAIYYTRDGSLPTTQDSLYQQPISMSQTQLIQAKGFKSGFNSTATTAEIFFINDRSALPTLNVQSDPDNFWDNQNGIYVQGTNGIPGFCTTGPRNWNQDWERPCRLTYIEPDGTKGFEVNAGVKIGGACSRTFKMKSFNFFLRSNEYGDEKIDYQLFPQSDVTEYRRFKIRNSGNDWESMMFRDGMNHTILSNTVDLDLMAYRPVRVYLNGEYWGIYGMRETFTKHHVESHYGVDGENLDILANPSGPGKEVREGDFTAYNQLINFVTANDLSEPAKYQQLQIYLDLQEYLNYHIVQIYLGNYDWPANNVRVWRDRNGGKFRWMLFDTDATTNFGIWGNSLSSDNTLEHALNDDPFSNVWPNGTTSTFLLRKLLENPSFKAEFVQRMCTFRALIFAPDRVNPMIDSLTDIFRPEVLRYMIRWKNEWQFGNGFPGEGTPSAWINNVNQYKDFFRTRQSHILGHYGRTLELSGTYDLTFGYDDSTKGEVFIHENEMRIPFNYQGKYFRSLPIKIKAVPQPGYKFSYWLETGDTLAETEYIGLFNSTITPVFIDSMALDTIIIMPPDTMIVDSSVGPAGPPAPYQVRIFPNPVKDVLSIKYALPKAASAQLNLYNTLGQRVLGKKLLYTGDAVLKEEIVLSHLAHGVYWLVVKDDFGREYVRLVVVE